MTLLSTARATDLLGFIERYVAAEAIAPSYAEMRDHLGLKSKSGIDRLLTQLEERGHIVRRPCRARCLDLTPSRSITIATDLYLELHTAANRAGRTPHALAAAAIRAWLDSD